LGMSLANQVKRLREEKMKLEEELKEEKAGRARAITASLNSLDDE
jgi:hypothetical protein